MLKGEVGEKSGFGVMIDLRARVLVWTMSVVAVVVVLAISSSCTLVVKDWSSRQGWTSEIPTDHIDD